MEQPVYKGQDTAEIFENAEYVVEGSFHSQHEPHCRWSRTLSRATSARTV